MKSIPKVKPLKLFLEIVPRPPADNVATRVAWVFSCNAVWVVYVSTSRPSWDLYSLRGIYLGIRFMENVPVSAANLSCDSLESFQ